MNQKLWFEQLRMWLYKVWVFTGFIALIAIASGAHIRVNNTGPSLAENILVPENNRLSPFNIDPITTDQCNLKDLNITEKSCNKNNERSDVSLKHNDKHS